MKTWYEIGFTNSNGKIAFTQNGFLKKKDLVSAIDLMKYSIGEEVEHEVPVKLFAVDLDNIILLCEESGYLYTTNPKTTILMVADLLKRMKPCNMRTVKAISLKESKDNFIDKILTEAKIN
jgi:hypothetical protein